jgi:hypothetical protein
VEDALAVALLKGFDNGTAALYRTNFDTQSQALVFSVRAKLWPGDAGEILSLPLGDSSSEAPAFVTVYNMLIGGVDETPELSALAVGDELVFTGKDSSSALLDGRWRVIASPLIWVGGKTTRLNTIQFKVVRI